MLNFFLFTDIFGHRIPRTTGRIEKMLDFLFYRDIVIETISDGQHIEREVYELRFDLFLRAADCFFNGGQRISEILEPFPSCFYDVLTKTRQYDDLKSCISVIPRLCEINVSNFETLVVTTHFDHFKSNLLRSGQNIIA